MLRKRLAERAEQAVEFLRNANHNKLRSTLTLPLPPKRGRGYECRMRPLRYSINLTLDGCVDHRVGVPDEELHLYSMEIIAHADALIFGRTTYELMESAWRPPASDAFPEWTQPFARAMDAAKKYVVSSTLERVDWNAELLRGDLGDAVRALKAMPGDGLYTGGVMLPKALAELGLIDEYEFIVHPRIVGHGPALFAGLAQIVDLNLVGRREFKSGAVALKYVANVNSRPA